MRIGRNMTRTWLNIRADQMDRLKELSSETGVSMAFMVRKGIEWYLGQLPEARQKIERNVSLAQSVH